MSDKQDINELAKNPKVKEILKKIIDKIEHQKKYKKNSIEMLEEIKKTLIEISTKQNELNNEGFKTNLQNEQNENNNT